MHNEIFCSGVIVGILKKQLLLLLKTIKQTLERCEIVDNVVYPVKQLFKLGKYFQKLQMVIEILNVLRQNNNLA